MMLTKPFNQSIILLIKQCNIFDKFVHLTSVAIYYSIDTLKNSFITFENSFKYRRMVLYISTGYWVLSIVCLDQLKGACHTHISYHFICDLGHFPIIPSLKLTYYYYYYYYYYFTELNPFLLNIDDL